MSKFDELANKAKADFERKTAQQTQDDAARAEARRKSFAESAAVLKSEILEPVNEAAAALRRANIDVRVTSKLDQVMGLNRPCIKVQLYGPRREGDGWQFEGKPLFIEAEEGTITAGLGKFGSAAFPEQRQWSSPPKKSVELVEAGVEEILADYYKQLGGIR